MIDTLDDEYSSAHKAARQYIDTQKEQSSDASEMLSIDLLNRMSISDKSETFRKDGLNVSHEVGIVSSHSNACNSVSFIEPEMLMNTNIGFQKCDSVYEAEPMPAYSKDHSMLNEQPQALSRAVVRNKRMNAEAKPFESSASNSSSPSIGQELWRQLKRVEIPKFGRDKKNYQSWKASFIACVYSAPATDPDEMPQVISYCNFASTSLVRL